MRRIEIEITDKEYALLLFDAMRRGGDGNMGARIGELIRDEYYHVGTVPFDEQIMGHKKDIEIIQKFRDRMWAEGLSQFTNEIDGTDPERPKEE